MEFINDIKTGSAITFEYDGVNFLLAVTGNYCRCFAADQFQYGFELGQNGEIETTEDLITMTVINYDNGFFDIEE